ncbi:uncharacterized protein CTRU02_13854 [Neofusicoccum parvum]|nr:uncharacterized protein CTRU02_13854 [Neofusicoccum parvum]
MKLVTFLSVLLLQPLTALACAHYNRCHCYDSDGKPNDEVTAGVCDANDGYLADASAASDGAKECVISGNNSGWDNCAFRVACQKSGATGSDSSCREKI